MNGNTYRTLEFDSIRALLDANAGSRAGRERLARLRPSTELSEIRAALGATTEAARLLQAIGRQPYHDLPDLTDVLPASRVSGLHLEPGALSDVASFIEGGVEIAQRVAHAEGASRLSRAASEVDDTRALAQLVRRSILPGGEVADEASSKLAETRRAIVRLRARLQTVMDSYLNDKDAERALQDRLVTTRNDRYVLVVKSEQRGQLPGIIHGSSGSGASVFVEPLPAVELNNDIVSLHDEERREIVRILQELTGRVGAAADALERAVDVLGQLDALQAMALLARDMDATEPEIADDLRLDLRRARHPLLIPRLAERLGMRQRPTREPVPVTLTIGFGTPVLIISGPNTGGKTVALKTVGLLALMAQCGLHVPADAGSVLPAFRRIYADIGDEQSIEASLSTFSAHLATIVEMTRDLTAPALVLLDEVGAGTDPTEGGALGVAIVDHFRARGAMVVATTHHGLMKAYAQSTPGVACASFQYDPQTYAPTYRLALGVPGRSLALEMAERLGLPAPVVGDARSRRDQKEAQAEALLKTLEEQQAELRREREALEALRRAITDEREAQRAELSALEARKRQEVEGFKRELSARAEEVSRRAADAIQKAVARVEAAKGAAAAAGARARTEALAAIRTAQAEALTAPSLGLAPEPETQAVPLGVGGRARIKDLGVVGEILALGPHGDAEIAVAGKRLRVPRAALVGLGPSGAARGAAGYGKPSRPERVQSRGDVPAEINLVGLTVDEALPRVDKLLDDACLADCREVRVIHGFGAGRLRRAVAGLLEGHPHVAGFRAGDARSGGAGVTIVELKD